MLSSQSVHLAMKRDTLALSAGGHISEQNSYRHLSWGGRRVLSNDIDSKYDFTLSIGSATLSATSYNKASFAIG